MKQLASFDLISNVGINLIPKSKPIEVHNYSWKKINSNQIVFSYKMRKNKTKELLRHLRNCIAHSNINRYVINDVLHYKFEDIYWKEKNVPTYTLKGYIKASDWENFVDYIYKESKALQPTSSTPSVQGKINLSPCSNSDITVKGKIQL